MHESGKRKLQKKSFFLLIFILLIPSYIIFAQEANSVSGKSREDFWVSLGVDAGFYSITSVAYGGGLSIGYGTGLSVGFKAAWYYSTEGLETLELSLLLRFYLFGKDAYSGPFLQLMGGPALLNNEGNFSIPTNRGAFSCGIKAGLRFLFNERWFLEPAIRCGYPYILTAGISAGARF